jgi:oxalate decarboxylase
MSKIHRRDFLARAGAISAGVTAALVGARRAEAGDASFMNNVPAPLLTGKELPTFKFALEKSQGRVNGKSTAKQASVEELPISRGIAGVSMGLEPGGMRELHWHATAAEWAFVDKGRVRTTVFGPEGYGETNEFEPGDIWYFPRGHGHMLECVGDEPCHFILIFDNGYFSEFGTFSVTDWIAHTPGPLLAKNFGVPESSFDGFPKDEVYITVGPLPPQKPAVPLGGVNVPPLTHKYRLLADPPHIDDRGGRMWLADSTRFPISKTAATAILDLDPGAVRGLHWHPTADEWQYVLQGRIRVTLFGAKGRYRTETLEKGDVAYIPQGYGHSIENVGAEKCRVLLGFNSGTYETIDLSAWIAGNPSDVLATNFGKPKALFEKFPHRDVFLAPKGGPKK